MLVLLPSVEVITRLFGTTGIVASPVLVQHFTLWIGFVGAVLASRRNKLLSLSNSSLYDNESQIDWLNILQKITPIFIVLSLLIGSWDLITIEMDYPVNIAPFIPRWTALIIMPIGFLSIAFHMINNSYSHFNDKAILFIFVYLLIILITNDFFQESSLFMYFSIGLIFFSLYKGAPIFTALGGLSILFFLERLDPFICYIS